MFMWSVLDLLAMWNYVLKERISHQHWRWAHIGALCLCRACEQRREPLSETSAQRMVLGDKGVNLQSRGQICFYSGQSCLCQGSGLLSCNTQLWVKPLCITLAEVGLSQKMQMQTPQLQLQLITSLLLPPLPPPPPPPLFWRQGFSVRSPSYPGICFIDQAGLWLPASAPKCWGLKMCTTTPS